MASLVHLTFVSLLIHCLPSTFYAIERGIMGERLDHYATEAGYSLIISSGTFENTFSKHLNPTPHPNGSKSFTTPGALGVVQLENHPTRII
ncbi:hypothetical protein M8J77_010976 [Diaphorina citri]|nr:hypothetical protein M8J77_010976 [Diaphorina citri]